MTKRCGTCKVVKPVKEFGANRAKRGGLQSSCRTCRRGINAAYYQRTRDTLYPSRQDRKRRVVDQNRQNLVRYLLEHPCVDCGEIDVVVLQFDHQSDKVTEVSALVTSGVSWRRILAEIVKCDVVCANDHARRTAGSYGWFKATLASSEAEHSALNGGAGMSEFPRGTGA